MIKTGLIFFSFLLIPFQALALPPEFIATYKAESYGIVAAQATYTLSHDGDGLNFSQRTEAVGLLSLFNNDSLVENSSISMHGDNLLLDEYSYVQRGDNKDRDIHLVIDWNQSEDNKLSGNISGIAAGREVNIKVNQPIWDTLSFQLPMMMHLPTPETKHNYKILVKGEARQYSFISHGEEAIKLGEKTIKTVKIERNSGNADKPFYLWVAPELHNLPVKYEKWKNGKAHITMSLKQVRFPADEQLRFDAEEYFDDNDSDFDNGL